MHPDRAMFIPAFDAYHAAMAENGADLDQKEKLRLTQLSHGAG